MAAATESSPEQQRRGEAGSALQSQQWPMWSLKPDTIIKNLKQKGNKICPLLKKLLNITNIAYKARQQSPSGIT